MTYSEALNFIINKQSLGIMPGLSRIKRELEKLNNPQNSFKTVHVAGTNGKGTVAASIADSLTKAGYKVGLFTSPWVTDYREQIQLGGKMISEDDFLEFVKLLTEMNTECTEFECLTLIAYLFFRKEKVDFAVIECGMGGSGDATNTELENLSVITSISLDHTDFLGNTINEIAEEKSGILRRNCTCVLYNDELSGIFKNKCGKLVTLSERNNLSLVNAALKELGMAPRKELVRLPARLERIGDILLDGGHNKAAAKMLSPYIENAVAVIGMMRDKDVDRYLSIIAPGCSEIIATAPDNSRSMSAEELALIAKKYCGNVRVVTRPEKAIKEKGVNLVCGSFYLAREVRKLLLSL